ncbi:MAG: hypothetical protein ACP5G8_02760, partial [Athalassotoga sp.]
MNYENFRFLRFVHNFYDESKKIGCLYNALTLDTIYYDQTLFEIIDQGLKSSLQTIIQHLSDSTRLEELLRTLLLKNMIVRFEYNEMDLMSSVAKKVLKGPKIKNLIMLMTDSCNMGCNYCYIEKSLPVNYNRSSMSIKTAKASIDKFISIANLDAKE